MLAQKCHLEPTNKRLWSLKRLVIADLLNRSQDKLHLKTPLGQAKSAGHPLMLCTACAYCISHPQFGSRYNLCAHPKCMCGPHRRGGFHHWVAAARANDDSVRLSYDEMVLVSSRTFPNSHQNHSALVVAFVVSHVRLPRLRFTEGVEVQSKWL